MTLEERLENLRSLYNVLRMSVMSRGRGNGKTILVVCAGAVADAIAILQEQEPVTMKPSYFNYVCSGCGSEIDGEFIEYTGGKIKFCPWCGRMVKWDDA